MRAAGYIRVSSEMQVENGHSLETQAQLIRDYCQQHGWTLVELFTDAANRG